MAGRTLRWRAVRRVARRALWRAIHDRAGALRPVLAHQLLFVLVTATTRQERLRVTDRSLHMPMEHRTPRVEVGELVAEPAQFAAQRIEVAGHLQSEGSLSSPDLRLVLRDHENHAIPVTPWLPPEAAPAPRQASISPLDTISDYLGQDVVLLGTWERQGGDYLLCVEMGHIARSPAGHLTPDEIARVGGVGGVGVHGRGVLHGWLHVRRQRVVLVTDNPGTRQEVCFGTDLHEGRARACDGERIAVSGIIRKLSPWSGTISRARLGTVGSDLHYAPGQYVVLTGVVEDHVLVGEPGAVPPSGSWLVLPRSIHVDHLRTKTVYLKSPSVYPDGYSARFHGRVASRSYGRPGAAGDTCGGRYAVLTGISDLRTGEPLYDGAGFRSAVDGAPLRALVLAPRQLAHDRPSVVVVLEPDQDAAHTGTLGGAITIDESPFHGFHGQAPVAGPTRADRKAIRFDEQGNAFSAATGEPLRVLERERPEQPDAASTVYLFDENRYTVYQVASGGAAGPAPRLARVIAVPRQ